MTIFYEFQGIVSDIDAETWIKAERWYSDANKLACWLSRRYDVPVSTVAGIMAVFSIRTSWKDNKRRLVRFLATGEIRGTKLQRNKIQQIRKTSSVKRIMQILSGDKIKRFFHNILFPSTSPFATLDSWMIKPLETFGVAYGQLTTKGGFAETLYRRIERAIRLVAQSVGRSVATVQAAVWIYLRGDDR